MDRLTSNRWLIFVLKLRWKFSPTFKHSAQLLCTTSIQQNSHSSRDNLTSCLQPPRKLFPQLFIPSLIFIEVHSGEQKEKWMTGRKHVPAHLHPTELDWSTFPPIPEFLSATDTSQHFHQKPQSATTCFFSLLYFCIIYWNRMWLISLPCSP